MPRNDNSNTDSHYSLEYQARSTNEHTVGRFKRTGSLRRRGNTRRVPTAQRMRTMYRLTRKLLRWSRPLLMLAVLYLLTRTAWAHLRDSSYFALQHIDYTETKGLSKTELLQIAGIKTGDSLLTLPLADVAQRLRKHPRIYWVSVLRKFPNRLKIRIKAHDAVALIQLQHFYLMNEEGVPFARVWDTAPYRSLLKITGFQRSQYDLDPPQMHLLFRQALAIHRLQHELKLHHFGRLHTIQYDPVLGYLLFLGQTKIYLGNDQFKARLERLYKLYHLLWRKGARKLRYVYINNRRDPRRVTFRLEDAVTVKESQDKKAK